MAIKELTTRIALKYDTFENWSKTEVADQGANLVLLRGEIGICEVPSVNAASNVAPTVLFKVGDGTKKFSELPWASAKAADVYGWAKKSEEEFKTWLNTEAKFATDAEVEAIRSGLDSRITAIEGSIGTGGKVASDIADLQTRVGEAEQDIADLENNKLDASVYEAYIAGKEMSDKDLTDYADGKASAAETAAKGYADGIVATEKSAREAADSALSGRLDVIEGEGVGSVKKAEADAKAYTDEKLADYTKTDGLGDLAFVDKVKAIYNADGYYKVTIGSDATELKPSIQVKTNGDEEGSISTYEFGNAGVIATTSDIATEVATLNAKDAELANAIAGNTTAIGNEVTARENAVNAINAKLDVEKVSTAIATAKSEAIAAAKSETDGQVNTLTEKVNKNTGDISTLSGTVSSEIARVEGLVSTEATNRENADNAIIERLESVETFFKVEGEEKLDTALDTLKEIQDYLNGEGEATGGMIGRVAALETGVENLEGRMDTAEDDIDALEGRATAVEGRATTLEGKVAALEAKPFDTYATKTEVEAAQKAADDAQDAADAAQGEVDALEGVVSTLRSEYDVTKALATANEAAISALDGRVGTAEGKITALETASAKHAEKTYVDEELAKKVNVSDYNTAIGNVYTKDEADGKFGLKTAVEKNATDIGTNASNIADLTGRVTTAEGNITTIQGIVSTGADSNANLRSAITSLQTLTGADGAIRQEIAAAKKAGDDAAAAVTALTNGQVATNKTNIEGLDSRITAVENDYVKASDLIGDFYVFNCGSSTKVTHVVPNPEN